MIQVDYHEKLPIGWPSTVEWSDKIRGYSRIFNIEVQDGVYLDTADFRIEGYDHITSVERKNDFSELEKNLFSADKGRQSRMLDRFQKTLYPVLWLEADLQDYFWQSSTRTTPPAAVYARLLSALQRRGISLLWLPCPTHYRNLIGHLLITTMWSIIWEHQVRVAQSEAQQLLPERKHEHAVR